MVTMARGKAEHVEPLMDIWEDGYHVLSRTRTLTIVGYSMPDDDVEIRTLLRAGVCRGSENPTVTVQNPAPDVHVRVRRQVFDDIWSNYGAIRGVPG